MQVWVQRVDSVELRLCELINRSCRRRMVRRFFATISRLGDGVFWCALMALLPLFYGPAGAAVSFQMGLVGIIGVVVYQYLKSRLVRQRPYVSCGAITLGAAPLDAYSFPSGHTLHAVSFTLIALADYPHLFWVLVPFAALVAASRVVLGLHYPTDVVVGALLGAALAHTSILFTA